MYESREAVERALDDVTRECGAWTYDIPLTHGVWTRGNLGIPNTRLTRVVQAVADLSRKPLSECRVLDLGCLEGVFSIEFARHGAEAVGVEIRESNFRKAMFCKEVLGLRNVEFRKDDARRISVESYGRFDAIVCSGLLYHLSAADVFKLVDSMFEMVNRVVLIDTHVALVPRERITHEGDDFWGHTFREYPDDLTPEQVAKRSWAAVDSPTTFWFTRPSLVNVLAKSGFSSIYECFMPAHLNFGKPGLEHHDRCTFIGLKDGVRELSTSPAANGLMERWPEKSLFYCPHEQGFGLVHEPLRQRVLAAIRRLVG